MNDGAVDLNRDTIEILISTCNERIAMLDLMMGKEAVGVSYLVIHQIFSDVKEESAAAWRFELESRSDVRVIVSRTRGLSVSRNIGLRNATANILLIADDDIRFLPDAFATIRAKFNSLDADIISFATSTPDGTPFRRYRRKPYVHNKLSIFHVSSIEIAIRRASIGNRSLWFDEKFGLGAQFSSCEENIFLADAIASGLRVYFSPDFTVVHPSDSSGGNWRNLNAVVTRGALFRRLFGWAGYPFLVAFALNQRKNYKAHHSTYQFIKIASLSFFGFSSKNS